MDPRTAATRVPDPDAVEFVRFCYRRRRVGWPELYDEMCAVAGRGLFRGYGTDDLAAFGIGFGLFDLPALASLARGIVAEEQALRRPMAVTITTTGDDGADISAHMVADVSVASPPPAPVATRPEPATPGPTIRFVPAASPV
jgi:hypothetical protein